MTLVTLTEAKKNLPMLMERVQQGETFTITYGRWKKPTVTLSTIDEGEKARIQEALRA